MYCTADRHVSPCKSEIERKKVGKRRERGAEVFVVAVEGRMKSHDMSRRDLTVIGMAFDVFLGS